MLGEFEMKKRCEDLIKAILEEQGRPVSLEQLSERFEVSTRTIRNDITDINSYLMENALMPLTLSKGFLQAESDFPAVLLALAQSSLFEVQLTAQERAQVCACILTSNPGYTTLAALADCLLISRQTIIKDLKLIKPLVASYGLEVVSLANKGLRIEGKESLKRGLLYSLLQQSSENARKFLRFRSGDEYTLRKIIKEQENHHGFHLTDASYQNIQNWLTISINRLQDGHFLEEQPLMDQPASFYRLAQDILKNVHQYLNVEISSSEIDALCLLLAKSRYLKQPIASKKSIHVQILTRNFIHAISSDLHLPLDTDYAFFENLSNHILLAFGSEPPQYPDQELLEEVIHENLDVLETVRRWSGIFESFAGRPLSDSDLFYICIHVLAAMEKQKGSQNELRVYLVCQGGVGTSQYLLQKLSRSFDFSILGAVSAHFASDISKDQADLLISTVPLGTMSVESVVISPFFNDEDYIRILSVTRQISAVKASQGQTGSSDFIQDVLKLAEPILEELAPERKKEILKQLKLAMRRQFHTTAVSDHDIFAPYLHHILTPAKIQVNIPAADWKEAIRLCALPMLQRGSIEERYIDAMIASVLENGPYIELTDGFALPHEASDSGAVITDFQLIRLLEPVDFGHDEFGPVRYVCCLSAPDSKTHLKAFFHLVNMLQDPSFLKELDHAALPEEIAACIEQREFNL